MDKVLVSIGQFVHAGTPIGLEGSTGWSTGPHVHYMVWVAGNQFVDPFPYYGSVAAITG
jgi:murein DD-endopeptidase MepM/ murein hydrolase activator NlpD